MFQLFQAIKRHAAAVLEQRDHGSGGFVVFFGPHSFGFWCREHFAAQIAAQTIQLVHRGGQRRLTDNANQRSRFFLWIDFSLFAARAVIARVQCGMRYRNFLGAGIGGSSVAPVAFGLFFVLLPRRIGWRKHRTGLLGRPWRWQHARQRVQRFFELVVIRFAKGASRAWSSTRSSSSRFTSTRLRFTRIVTPETCGGVTSPTSA